MKFRDKLFLSTIAMLMVIFSVFGILMLSSYFQKLLNREIEQVNTESRMYQYLYEMDYQSMLEYGSEYAITKSIDHVVGNVEKEGVSCFVMTRDREFLYNSFPNGKNRFVNEVNMVLDSLTEDNTYVYGIRQMEDRYYLIHISKSMVSGEVQYLGICRDLTDIYEDRDSLMRQYQLSMVFLLVIGSVCVYVLSHVMTRPIRELGYVAGRIAAGDYELRSAYRAKDEIGELAADFNRMADKLVKQMKEKEQEATRKADFTASFAHELKTPLTSIIGYADMMSTVNLSDEERLEASLYIFNQGKRLESLSHKLLELAGMDRKNWEKKPVLTKQLEENIRTTMRPIFQKKKIKSKITMEKATLAGDSELLLSLLYNLLDNAYKAVEEGGFVFLKGRNLGEEYEIKVIDNGRGIPEQEISRITEAFYMVDKSRSRKEGGAGIGLALCKQIVTMHEGDLKIVSNPGEGTVVRLLFPLAAERTKPDKNAEGKAVVQKDSMKKG